VWVLAIPDVETSREWHTSTIDSNLEQKELELETFWSKAFAVGGDEWVKTQLRSAGIKSMKLLEAGDVSYAIGGNV
jgi:hypothetical protein